MTKRFFLLGPVASVSMCRIDIKDSSAPALAGDTEAVRLTDIEADGREGESMTTSKAGARFGDIVAFDDEAAPPLALWLVEVDLLTALACEVEPPAAARPKYDSMVPALAGFDDEVAFFAVSLCCG